MKQHITRAYNTFDINPTRGTITKHSTKERLRDEINYYQAISQTANGVFFPRMLSSNFSDDTYHLELEYYAYDNLGDYMVYQEFDKHFWELAAASLRTTLEMFSNDTVDTDFSQHAAAMYIAKTEHYYEDLLVNDKFGTIASHDSLTIGGKRYVNFAGIWEDVKKKISASLLAPKQGSVIHGDMCFSNILCGVNPKTDTCVLKFVDPRGNFGVDGIYGDPLYDYAKLVHSYRGGYEYIIFDQFSVEENSDLNEFNVVFANGNKEKIAEVFNDFSDPRASLIEGLIYIGMCSRHYDSIDRQTAMYTTGIQLLNEALE